VQREQIEVRFASQQKTGHAEDEHERSAQHGSREIGR
jgi:hypothetical protein